VTVRDGAVRCGAVRWNMPDLLRYNKNAEPRYDGGPSGPGTRRTPILARVRFLISDRDGKHPALIDEILSTAEIAKVVTGVRWQATHWLVYGVEPLFSGLLMLTMNWHAQGARWGRPFPGAGRARLGVIAFEVGLLLAVILIKVSLVVPGLGCVAQRGDVLGAVAAAAIDRRNGGDAGGNRRVRRQADDLGAGRGHAATTRVSAEDGPVATLVPPHPKHWHRVITPSPESQHGRPRPARWPRGTASGSPSHREAEAPTRAARTTARRTPPYGRDPCLSCILATCGRRRCQCDWGILVVEGHTVWGMTAHGAT
jgi:hypothetical protein